ncbi:VWA domain-containing protein [Clostridiaceae bacterium HSG29]|nr:VWA domain-containing protein [Clostridiaceae bacterium HSG29]
MTKVKVPFSLTNELKYKIGEVDQGIDILNIKEVDNKVNIRFSLVDKNTQEILPNIENTEAFEGTFKTEIDSINRVKSPPNIVLAVDSSGSMKGQMEKTIKSAKLFIESLQEDANIQIIDFDSKVTTMGGSSKEEALQNLSKIRVGGATVLYDATIQALDSLDGYERPTIVLFTDGEDANLYDTARGSVSDKENVLNAIKNSNIPIYSIGFGENPDKVTLGKFAEISNGQYFNAKDETALNEVFKSINDRLSNTYELIYNRPKESQLCDIPVVSFVIDTSGSMTNLSEEYNSIRITNVKNLFHEFIINLPDDMQMQLVEFNQDINLLQAMTIDKTKILREVADLYAGGATEILGSVEIGYKMLKSVPSTSKVLVYLTDAALEVYDDEFNYFNLILDKMKEDNIKVLWIGMGVEDSEDAFIYASEKSGGKYIITEDPKILKSVFDEMIKEVREEPKSELISTKIIINKVDKTGELSNYSASVLSNLSPKEKNDSISESETINYSFMELPKLKDYETAKFITGDTMDVTESKIIKRIKLNSVNKTNDAIKITANELVYLSKIKGLEPPSGYRFLAMTLDIENIIKEQEVMVYPDGSGHPSAWVSKSSDGELKKIKIPYLIPNYTSHFYVGYNSSGNYPASAETWLAEKPISNPSNFSISIEPEKIINGTMIFLVPDNVMNQLSLHYYDVNYGHIDIPLIGKMTVPNEEVKYLPKTATGKLTDTFSMEMNGFTDMNKDDFDFNIFNLENSIIRKVEANFISKMQALIDINPRERVKLEINTEKGDFYIPINEITSSIPSGFISKLMISPGSFNKIYMCYQIPNILKDNDFNIFVELKDEDALIGTDMKQYKMTDDYFSNEYFKLKVNDLIKIKEGDFENCVIADITIEDIKDDYSSYGIPELFSLQSEDYDETAENSGFSYNPELRDVYENTNDLLFGFSENTIIFDGTNRRGFLTFYLDDESINKEWYLNSTVFDELNYKTTVKDFDKGYLVNKTEYEKDYYYSEKLNEVLAKVINKYNSEHPESSRSLKSGDITIEKQTVEAPSISVYGATVFEEINSVDKLKGILKELKYIPSENEYVPFTYKYSKEAVLTQGYGTVSDLANLSIKAFSKLGYSPKLKFANLTEKGKDILKDISKVDNIKIDSVPAIVYKENDVNHTFVIPFMTEIENIRSLVYFENSDTPELVSDAISMRIFVNAISKNENASAKISDFSDALAGEVDDRIVTSEVDLLNTTINTDTLSLDAIDISFVKNQNKISSIVMTKGKNI